jgi:hypothetical protein
LAHELFRACLFEFLELNQPVDEEKRGDAEQDPVEEVGNPPALCESQSIIGSKEKLTEKTGQCPEEIRSDHIVFFKINTNLLGLCDKVFTLARNRSLYSVALWSPEGQK